MAMCADETMICSTHLGLGLPGKHTGPCTALRPVNRFRKPCCSSKKSEPERSSKVIDAHMEFFSGLEKGRSAEVQDASHRNIRIRFHACVYVRLSICINTDEEGLEYVILTWGSDPLAEVNVKVCPIWRSKG